MPRGEADGVVLLPLNRFKSGRFAPTGAAVQIANPPLSGRVAIRLAVFSATAGQSVVVAHDAATCTINGGFEIAAGETLDLELPVSAQIWTRKKGGAPTLNWMEVAP